MAAVNANGGPNREIPEDAIGECEESADCPGEGAFCIFFKEEIDDVSYWSPSICGVEADCNEEENKATREDPDFDKDNNEFQFCAEHFGGTGGMMQ